MAAHVPHVFRLKATMDASTGHDIVSNAHMRYVADPLEEDPGVAPPPADDAKAGAAASVSTAASTKKKGGGGGGGKKKLKDGAAGGNEAPEAEGGRPSILTVLREFIGKGRRPAKDTARTSGSSLTEAFAHLSSCFLPTHVLFGVLGF